MVPGGVPETVAHSSRREGKHHHTDHRYQGSHFQITGLEGTGSKSGLHSPSDPPVLSNGTAGPSSYITLGRSFIGGTFTGFIGHSPCGTDIFASYYQIKQTGLTDQRNLCHTHIKANIPLLQILLDSACRIQAKGAASREEHSIDPFRRSHRI